MSKVRGSTRKRWGPRFLDIQQNQSRRASWKQAKETEQTSRWCGYCEGLSDKRAHSVETEAVGRAGFAFLQTWDLRVRDVIVTKGVKEQHVSPFPATTTIDCGSCKASC